MIFLFTLALYAENNSIVFGGALNKSEKHVIKSERALASTKILSYEGRHFIILTTF